jgi:hypothetical protein
MFLFYLSLILYSCCVSNWFLQGTFKHKYINKWNLIKNISDIIIIIIIIYHHQNFLVLCFVRICVFLFLFSSRALFVIGLRAVKFAR